MLAPPASIVREVLRSDSCTALHAGPEEDLAHLADRLLRRRHQFGITRVGSITRLDRVGVSVVQAVRPMALSNCVSQGKGCTFIQATVSALLESLETWAAERIPSTALSRRAPANLPAAIQELYAGSVVSGVPADWIEHPLSWVEGWDLFEDRPLPVPAALVDTVFTRPSPHPAVFPRTTTGLGAGISLRDAIMQAALEVLERDAVAAAYLQPYFFDRHQIDLTAVAADTALEVLTGIKSGGLVAGAWRVPAPHALPIYWCHVMEGDESRELVPLPAEGFGCAFADDHALAKALLEACQARLTVISGAREDLTRQAYVQSPPRRHLAEWRHALARTNHLSRGRTYEESNGSPRLGLLLRALKAAGARAAIVVPLYCDDTIGVAVVRLVAPPLRPCSYERRP